VTADGVMLPDDVRALVESVRKLMLYENDLPSQVVAALLDAYRERDEWRATARIEREERTKAEREAAQLRETLGWVEQWADSGNDNHLSLLLTVRAALAASRGDQSSRS
jgi:hypothetical protein